MTVGMLMTPFGVPVLMTDCVLVKIKDDQILDANRPEVIFAPQLVESPKANLVRKVMFLSSGIAIAFSGRWDQIELAMEHIGSIWPNLQPQDLEIDNVMERFKAENFRKRGLSSLVAIGRGSYSWATGAIDVAANTRLFGRVVAIGSGSQEILDQMKAWDVARADLKADEFTLESSHIISELIGAHRNRKLFLHNPIGSRIDWGGYIEAFIRDDRTEGWLVTSDWVHIYCDFDGRKYYPRYPYFIYKRLGVATQSLFRVDEHSVSEWKIEMKNFSGVDGVVEYLGPFGLPAKVTATYNHSKTNTFYHSTSMYYQDGCFPTDDPQVIQDLSKFESIFDMLSANFSSRSS